MYLSLDPAAAVFWTTGLLLAYSYVIYPMLIWLFARLFGRLTEALPLSDDELPTVSILIAAYNEEAMIEQRIANLLAVDYPTDRLQIIIASDGSTDRTAAIVRQFPAERIRLLDFPLRRGKATVLNSILRVATGEIVVFSDANTMIDPLSIRRMVPWFRDARIAAVSGKLVLTDPKTGNNADGLYWRYENFMKEAEGKLGALLGANGAIYALRRSAYVPIANGTIVDDFMIPLSSVLRDGSKIVYEPTAVAHEETPANIRDEFRRRVRIGAGGYQSLATLWPLLDPRRGWIALAFLSHKVLRWAGPFLMFGLLLSNIVLSGELFYARLLATQSMFYLAAAMASYLPRRSFLRPCRLPAMFVSMNAALFLGFCRWLSGRCRGVWERTPRELQPNF